MKIYSLNNINVVIVYVCSGLIWGLLALKGFLGLVLFAAISAGVVYVWFTAVQVCAKLQGVPYYLIDCLA